MNILQFKESNCKNCYKCIRNCPLKAIEVKNHQAQIIEASCVLCGKCTLVCPQNSKRVRRDAAAVRDLIRSGREVIASVAPSFIAHYDVTRFGEFKDILLSLGFSGACEAALGACLVKSEYENLVDRQWNRTIISSCCPTVINLIEKHYPDMIQYLAPVLSPMQATAKFIRRANPDACVVFIGPCISKKDECEKEPGLTDFALTFDELNGWIRDAGDTGTLAVSSNVRVIADSDAARTRSSSFDGDGTHSDIPEMPGDLARFFPVPGGILRTMKKNPNYKYLCVDEIRSCIGALEEIENGGLQNCFIEMSSCKGSCINGPCTGRQVNPALSCEMKVMNFAAEAAGAADPYGEGTESVLSLTRKYRRRQIRMQPPNAAEVEEILKRLGKTSRADELNCGTCGYATCRDKAAAIYFGKAEISMCLPYMQQCAESLADKIINATPNAILTVDSDLSVRQINTAACRIFCIGNPKDVIGGAVSRIMDDSDFVEVFAFGEQIVRRKRYLAEYGKYLEQTFLLDKNNNIAIGIMADITNSEIEQERIRKARQDTIAITDKILDRQLHIVHEIASLLGETAADTKIAITELKNSVLLEKDGAP